mmetsp:Transcript_27613/g.66495  ORF Transcript_27613/g.66495 Transcript_27613/m.66495 type:complete len:281 (+) Transcript_27613:68-910(+)
MPPSKRTKRSTDSLASLPSPASKKPSSKASSSTPPPPPSRRRVVKIAKDADAVLAKCRALRDDLRRGRMLKERAAGDDDGSDGSSDDAWAFGGVDDDSDDDDDFGKKKKAAPTQKTAGAVLSIGKGGAKTQQLSLAELKGHNHSTSAAIDAVDDDKKTSIVEVVNMNSTEVMEGIENVAVGVAMQVLRKKGFQLDIPSRAASNQIYVPELDRIVLGDKRGTRSFLNVKEARKTAITTRVLQLLHAVLSKRIHITVISSTQTSSSSWTRRKVTAYWTTWPP